MMVSGAIVALLIVLAVLRERIPTGTLDGAVLLHPVEATNFIRPIRLVGFIVGELLALQWTACAAERRGLYPAWIMSVTCAVAVALGLVYSLMLQVTDRMPEPLVRAFVSGPTGGLQVFALWILAFWYPKLAREAGEREREAERLRAAAELARLREHLQPHFLRNTLNTIAAVMIEEPGEARALLAALGDLLSDASAAGGPTQTLADEIAWLRRYAQILEARHRGVLRFVWDLDPDASGYLVPRLLLQPLVENAVQHGALVRADDGWVSVTTRRTREAVSITVEDNGPGFDPEAASQGLGLRLVRRRLTLECPGADLSIRSSGEGTRALLELP